MKKIGIVTLVLSALLCTSVTQAAPILFSSTLGPEVVGATGTGSVLVTFDTTANTLGINANWSGLSGTTSIAHIHCCTAAPLTGTVGVAVTPGTLPGFPVGTLAGTYSIVLDSEAASTYTPSFVTAFGGGTLAGAEAALLAALQTGQAYFNVHTTTFPGGEIRGFPLAVPEPMSISLLAIALLGLFFIQRRKQNSTVEI